MRREIEEIFLGLGFEVRTGPWIETEWNNFDALNTPHDHPARDMQDTFFVEGGRILRSHTSPVQIRTMLAGPPPVRIVAPGNVFRRDDDATHTPMFPQMEGLLVDEGVSFAELKGTLLHFVHRFFGPRLGVRLRPSYFPFTEPSAEVDADCYLCEGGRKLGPKVCRLCKGSGWIEIGGAGMVHPNVFRAVGYDPREVSRASPSAWACRAWRCSSTASTTCAPSTSTTCAFCRNSGELETTREDLLQLAARARDLKPGVTADSVAEKLSLAGLEVESIDRRGRDLDGVVVAEVLGKRPHPSADTLSIVRLRGGRRAKRRSSAARPMFLSPAARSPGRSPARRCQGARRSTAARSAA